MSSVLNVVFSSLISFVNLLLAPIDSLINTYIPDLSNALSGISNFLSIIGQNIAWCVSLTGLSSSAISLIILYYIFILSVKPTVYFFKLIVKWIRSIIDFFS